jgi:carboxymethylenebutenolidase
MKFPLPRTLAPAALFLLPLTLHPVAARAQDWAKARLEASTRHREYVPLKVDNRTVQALVVYPETKSKATVVVLIHEIFGLSDWAKEMADELAAEGFIVIAPDMLSGHGPHNGGSDSLATQDDRIKAVSALDPAEVLADLDAAADYGKKLPAANGKVAVAGFCWGGANPSPLPLTATTSALPLSFTEPPLQMSLPSPRPSTASTGVKTRASMQPSPQQKTR